MVKLKFLSKIQLTSKKQKPVKWKHDGKGDCTVKQQKKQVSCDIKDLCKDKIKKNCVENDTKEKHNDNSSLLKSSGSKNDICGSKNNLMMCNSKITENIKHPQNRKANSTDNRPFTCPLLPNSSTNDKEQIKDKLDPKTKCTHKKEKNIQCNVRKIYKKIIKYFYRFLYHRYDKKYQCKENINKSDKSKLNHPNVLGISTESNDAADSKQIAQVNMNEQGKTRIGNALSRISLNKKSTSKEFNNEQCVSISKFNIENEKNLMQSRSGHKRSQKDNSNIEVVKPYGSIFNNDAICFFASFDDNCITPPPYLKGCDPKELQKLCRWDKKIDVGVSTNCCLRNPKYSTFGKLLCVITAKLKIRSRRGKRKRFKSLKNARNQTKVVKGDDSKKEPVCVILENVNESQPPCLIKCPSASKLCKKKVVFLDNCGKFSKGLIAIKIDPINKRIINKKELKSILKSLPKDKKCPPSRSSSKVDSKQKACDLKGPIFELKIDRKNMRILNYPEIKRKLRKLNNVCLTKDSRSSKDRCSWVITNVKYCNRKQVRDATSKISCLWGRCRCKSNNSLILKKYKLYKTKKRDRLTKEGRKSKSNLRRRGSSDKLRKPTSDFKIFSKVNRNVKKTKRRESDSLKTRRWGGKKHMAGKKNVSGRRKTTSKNKITKKGSVAIRRSNRSKKKQKTALHRKSMHRKSKSAKVVKKQKTDKGKIKKKKTKAGRRTSKMKGIIDCVLCFFKNKARCKNRKSSKKQRKKKSKASKRGICSGNARRKQHPDEALYQCQYSYLRYTKAPCLWLFVACPFLHRHFIMFRSIFYDFTRCVLLLLALVFWCPCFLIIELIRCFCTR